jgi:hypothetical protein
MLVWLQVVGAVPQCVLDLNTFSHFSLLWLQEEDNLHLAAQNQQMQREIAELQARIAAAEAAAAAAGSPPATPASEQWVDGVQARAAMALQRAADTRRLSGMFEVSGRRGVGGGFNVQDTRASCYAVL